MSQANLKALKAQYKRWAAGDWSDTSIFDPHAVGIFPDPGPHAHYGSDAMAAYMRRFLESWDDIRMEATDYREVGDSFIVGVHRVATGRGSGIHLDDHVFHVWTFRGRRAIRMELCDREAEALEVTGLRE